jgi:nicotinate-nucleotide--dimethylbenzimidazole phosphoribosyltransferase
MTDAPQHIDEIAALLADAPDGSADAAATARARDATLTKPPGALGWLEAVAEWLAFWQQRNPPRIDHADVVVFAGNHGVAARGVSAFPAEVTAQMVANFEAGGAAVNQLSRVAGASFRIVPLDLANPTEDFSQAPAMSEAAFVDAFAAGWNAVGDDTDLLAIGEMGIANTTSAAAVCHALFGGRAEDWTGPGTGVTGEALSMKARVVAEAVELHAGAATGPLDILRRLGGRELAAMAGATLAARYRHCPVLIDGYVSGAAVAALAVARPGALDHTLAAHVSAEPGHRRLLQALGMPPLLDLEMRLGEASGAALAINIVRAACACHTGMASFADAGVSGKPD